MDGIRGEDSIAVLCRREGISQGVYYKWSKDFMEAGKRRLAGDVARAATTDEIKDLHREARDLKGAWRAQPKVWPPKNANTTIHGDPAEQETFVVVKSAASDADQDVQINLRPDKIVLRRDYADAWNGILVTDHSVAVAVAGISIRINHDGSITCEDDNNTTWVEVDGSVLKKIKFVEASMSGDGIELARRTSTTIAAIREDGDLAKSRE